MRDWTAAWIAAAAGAELARPPARAGAPGPRRAVIDSRAAGPDDLFVGLPGTRVDGGAFAPAALSAGAWGALVAAEHAPRARAAPGGAVLVAADPLAALGRLARAWRRELGCRVVAVTGSTGKTSTKDLLAALLAPRVRTVASRANFNTEIGMPLELLGTPTGTEALVLELGMRGAGQIAELTAICEPDVGVVVNVGPVHLELLGSLEAVAATKAELIAGLAPGATAVVPAGEPLLAPHLRDDLRTVTFGAGGDVALVAADGPRLVVDAGGERLVLEVDLPRPALRANLLAAVAACRAIGATPSGRVDVALSARRGERLDLADGVVVIDDSYNANPMSMRAALDDLAATAHARGGGRSVAVLGDMLELGPEEARYHAEVGAHAAAVGVDTLVAVGPRAAWMGEAFGGEVHTVADAAAAAALASKIVRPGDTVLVKGSLGVGLQVVAPALAGRGVPA